MLQPINRLNFQVWCGQGVSGRWCLLSMFLIPAPHPSLSSGALSLTGEACEELGE